MFKPILSQQNFFFNADDLTKNNPESPTVYTNTKAYSEIIFPNHREKNENYSDFQKPLNNPYTPTNKFVQNSKSPYRSITKKSKRRDCTPEYSPPESAKKLNSKYFTEDKPNEIIKKISFQERINQTEKEPNRKFLNLIEESLNEVNDMYYGYLGSQATPDIILKNFFPKTEKRILIQNEENNFKNILNFDVNKDEKFDNNCNNDELFLENTHKNSSFSFGKVENEDSNFKANNSKTFQDSDDDCKFLNKKNNQNFYFSTPRFDNNQNNLLTCTLGVIHRIINEINCEKLDFLNILNSNQTKIIALDSSLNNFEITYNEFIDNYGHVNFDISDSYVLNNEPKRDIIMICVPCKILFGKNLNNINENSYSSRLFFEIQSREDSIEPISIKLNILEIQF